MSAPRRDNAAWQGGKVGKSNRYQRHDDSTAGEAQRRRIVEMLRRGRQTTLDFRRAGVMQSQTRIHELRAQGYDLPTVGRITVIDDQGFPHHGVALYELLAEPSPEVAP